MTNIDSLGHKWLESRSLLDSEYNHMKLVGFLTEEISEGISRLGDEHESVDWRVDCMIFLSHSLLQDGYLPSDCLKEAYKEINSRDGAFNEESGKWEKFVDPLSISKHIKADYTRCRIEEG